MALTSIAIEQIKATTSTLEKAKQLLNYLAANTNDTIRFNASDMIMNVHLDASYLSEANARSRACEHFFMGWNTKDGEPIKLNGAFLPSAPSSVSLPHLQPKPKSELSSLTTKRL
jgi:hypothetical protein